MNKKLKIILLIVAFLFIVSTISYCSAPYDTEPAELKTISTTIAGNGFILRNETVVSRDSQGVFEPLVKEGVRVSKGGTVGTIISGNLDNKLAERLEKVKARIEEIQNTQGFSNVYSSDDLRIYSVVKEMAGGIRTNADTENYIKAKEFADRLNTIIEKSAEKDASARDKLLVSLEEEKYSLEKQLGGIRFEVSSPAAGIFYTHLDGLERTIAKDDEIKSLTPGDINSFSESLKNYKKPSEDVAKICDTYSWYLASCISKEDAEGLSPNQNILISVDEQPFIKATILSLNEGEGEVALIVKSTIDAKGITEKRTVKFEIKKEEVSGICIPSESLRVLDNTAGVYIINQNRTVSFRAVNIIKNYDDYYIVQNKFIPPLDSKYKALKVHDNILINPEKVRGVVDD